MSWSGSIFTRLGRRVLIGSAAATAGVVAAYRNDLTQLQFDFFSALGPFLRLLDAETSHNVAIWTAKQGITPQETRPDPPCLAVTLWGQTFSNPVGLAAGFDKDGEAPKGLLGLGFGFMEVGSVTPLPQPGNPKPRSFRLPELGGLINRYGFNSQGVDAVQRNLQDFREQQAAELLRLQRQHQEAKQQADSGAELQVPHPQWPKGLLAVNLGKNKESEDAAADYAMGVRKLGHYADILVVNISSPNTPGLRALQGRKQLEALIKRVKQTRDHMQWGRSGPPPLLVKIAPDLTEADKSDIAAVSMKLGIDGLIISNTTITRPGGVVDHPTGNEAGGLSGKPLFELSTQVLSDMYRLTKGQMPIIGCGGVSSGEDAYRKIRAGATLVELYTGLAYEGPALVPRLKKQLAACLEADGFTSVQDAIGYDHRK